ncbi:MAG: orotidine-5'-phosphate decarboxylase [Bryobacteraceae bacterium]
MTTNPNPLILALDVDSTSEALNLIQKIGPSCDFYKVGMELYAVGGPEFVAHLQSDGKKVFLDLKLYDIGETVKRATYQICQRIRPTLLTVHGSKSVMSAARAGRDGSATRLLGVTVLTSFDEQDLADLGFPVPVSKLVELRVRNAVQTGMDGLICSPIEVARVREIAGESSVLVTPGVRSASAAQGDQKRVATPKQAIDNGATYLVIGRQVTRAADPQAAYHQILEEIAK